MWDLPDTHLETLKAVARRPPGTDDPDPDVLVELREWGMVMPHSFELTGMVARYAHPSGWRCFGDITPRTLLMYSCGVSRRLGLRWENGKWRNVWSYL